MRTLLLTILFFSGASIAAEIHVPLLSFACHFDGTFTTPRVNGYDCKHKFAVHSGGINLDPNEISHLEMTLQISKAHSRVSKVAEIKCGHSCRFFFGGWGAQCLAVAQSRRYTGLGAFTGREVSQLDAERSALRDCETFVGVPGERCEIVISECAGLEGDTHD